MHTNGPTRAAITARAIPALVLLSLWLGLTGCATSNPNPPLDRSFEHQWSGDIEVMYDTLPGEHKNLFFELPEAECRSRLVELNERASGLSAPEFEIELRRLLAVVGEPSGGRPNHYGEIKFVELPDLGRTLTYSTKNFHTYKGGDPPALMPDIEVPLSDAAYIDDARSRYRHPKLERELPRGVTAYHTEELAAAIEDADLIVSGVNSWGVDWIADALAESLARGRDVIGVTKGFRSDEAGDIEIFPRVLAGRVPAAIREHT